MNEILTLVGTLISVFSLGIAVLQTYRLESIRRLRVNSLRVALQNSRLAMLESDRLLNNRRYYGITDRGALIKLEAIHANSCGTIRSLFHELSQVDLPYDERRLREYAAIGLISSKWLWTQAALFLPKTSRKIKIPDLPEDTPDLMMKAGLWDDTAQGLVKMQKNGSVLEKVEQPSLINIEDDSGTKYRE